MNTSYCRHGELRGKAPSKVRKCHPPLNPGLHGTPESHGGVLYGFIIWGQGFWKGFEVNPHAAVLVLPLPGASVAQFQPADSSFPLMMKVMKTVMNMLMVMAMAVVVMMNDDWWLMLDAWCLMLVCLFACLLDWLIDWSHGLFVCCLFVGWLVGEIMMMMTTTRTRAMVMITTPTCWQNVQHW